MPLRTDGSPAIGDPLCVGTHVQLRVGGAAGRCLQVPPGGGKVGVAVEMARTLVEHGADVNPVDKWGKTPYQNLTSEEFAKKADPRAINRMKEALESMGAK